MKVERNVDFLIKIIAFTLSDARGTSVASREGARSRALVFSNDSVSKTIAGQGFFAIRFMDRREFTSRLACESKNLSKVICL